MSRQLSHVVCFVVASTLAESAYANSTAFSPDHLQLATAPSDFVATEGASPVAPWTAHLMAAFRWNDTSLSLDRGAATQTVVGARSFLEVLGGIELGRWVGIGLALPVLLDEGGALGDLRLVPRVELVHRGPFGLVANLGLRVPTGNTSKFIGEGMVVFEPRIAAQVDTGWFHLGLNVGVRVREERHYVDLTVGDEVFGSLAVAVTPRPWIDALVELHGDTALGAAFGARQVSPVEMLAGLGGGARGVRVSGVFGVGLVDGYGAARFRALVTVEIRHSRAPNAILVRATPPPPRAPPAPVVAVAKVEPSPAPEVEPGLVEEAHADEPDVALSAGRIELSQPIFFDTNRQRIHHRYFPELLQLARAIARRPALAKVWIEGHADATGPKRWNLQLSRKRANILAKFLVAHGVDPRRLCPVGFGEAQPLVPSRAGVSRDENRRVHFFTDASVEPAPMAESAAAALSRKEAP